MLEPPLFAIELCTLWLEEAWTGLPGGICVVVGVDFMALEILPCQHSWEAVRWYRMLESLPHGVDFSDKILKNDSLSILRLWVVIVRMWQIMAGSQCLGLCHCHCHCHCHCVNQLVESSQLSVSMFRFFAEPVSSWGWYSFCHPYV